MNVQRLALSLVGILALSAAPATATPGADRAPVVERVLVMHKKLVVVGYDFSPRAVVLIDGVEQTTQHDIDHPTTRLVINGGAAKVDGHDAAIQVKNPKGGLSDVYSTAAQAAQKTVTLDDDERTVTFRVGDEFLLYLGTDFTWTIDGFDTNVIGMIPQYVLLRGSQGLFQAKAAGRSTITVTGAPICEGDTPCQQGSRTFTVTIVVEP